MKILLILITTIVFSLQSFAKGEIDYVKSSNNVMLIGSNTNLGNIISAGAMKKGMIIAIANSKKAPLIYSLEQYTSNNKQQYALKVWVSPNKKMPSILNSNGKLLLKTAKGNNIELTSCFTEATINEAWNLSYTSSIFPISKEQLTKARIELLCLNTEKNTTEYSYKDYEYSKDEIGKNLKKWSEAIEKESKFPTITPEDNSPKDIHENF